MRTILATALALAALTSAALADGAVELTDTQLDQITAGVLVNDNLARGLIATNRQLDDDVIDTLLGFNRPTSVTEARGIKPGNRLANGEQIFSGGARGANPRVDVSRTGNPAVSTAFIPF